MSLQDERATGESESKGGTRGKKELGFTVVPTTRTVVGDTRRTTPPTKVRNVMEETSSKSEVENEQRRSEGKSKRGRKNQREVLCVVEGRTSQLSRNQPNYGQTGETQCSLGEVHANEYLRLKQRLKQMLRMGWGDYGEWGEVARTKQCIAELEAATTAQQIEKES